MRSIKLMIFLVTSVLLFGCTKTFHNTNNAIQRTQDIVHQRLAAADAVPSAALVRSGSYADTRQLTDEQEAFWLNNRISLNGRGLPLSFFVSRILRNSQVAIKYQPNVQRNRSITLNYNGTIKGALDELASKTNYAYEISDHGNTLRWVSVVTKTFNIAFMPGSATYMVGGQSSSSSSGGGGAAGGSSSGTLSSDKQHSDFQATLSLWTDLKNTLDELKSKDGKIYVSESTTSVTVSDRPSNVEEIARYIDQLNRSMSQQVKFKVQVLELQLDKSHALGVDWSIVQQWLGTHIGLQAQLASASNVSTPMISQIVSPTSPVSLQIGGDHSNAILRALDEQGKLSVVTEPTLVTMNNQVAEIRISRDTSYLQSVSQSTVVNGPTTASLVPGVVTDGFILFLLPKIQDDKIYLQITSTLSTLTALNTVGTQINSTQSGQQGQSTTIQVPTLAEKRFNIRGLVHNGNTLVIGGFRQVRNELRESKLFGSKQLGGEGAQQQNIETILLITPSIIESQT